MSGHSKWSTIKRQKEIKDAKRGNIFTKLGNNITIAVRQGGKDPMSNFKLRLAIEKSKQFNMPKSNIERAIRRGAGEFGGGRIEEVVYGGFLPGQYLIIIKCLTDNKNRTLTDIKTILQKNGGHLVELNSVKWQFESKGIIKIQNTINNKQGELEEIIINSGADDYQKEENEWIIYTSPEELQEVKEGLEQAGLKINFADLEMVAKEKKNLDDTYIEKIEKIFGLLDKLDDVSAYYTNLK